MRLSACSPRELKPIEATTTIDELTRLAAERRSIRGYDKTRDARPRRDVDETAHYDSYDMAKYRDDRQFQKFVTTASRRGYYGKRTWVEDDIDPSAPKEQS